MGRFVVGITGNTVWLIEYIYLLNLADPANEQDLGALCLRLHLPPCARPTSGKQCDQLSGTTDGCGRE